MNRINFLVEWYHKEIERTASLNNSLNIPIGVLTGILALIFFFIREFNYNQEFNFFILSTFIISLIISIVCWVFAVYYLCKSYNKWFKGYDYEELPFPTQLNEYYETMKIYYNENKKLLPSKTTTNKLYEKQLIEILSECLDTNLDNNANKSKDLHASKKYMFGCLLFIIICLIPFGLNYFKHISR